VKAMTMKPFIRVGVPEIQFGEKVPKDAVEVENWRFLSPLDVREIAFNLADKEVTVLDVQERDQLTQGDLDTERKRLAKVAQDEVDRLELKRLEQEEKEAEAKKQLASADSKSGAKNNGSTTKP
jgi:hypothetical protein